MYFTQKKMLKPCPFPAFANTPKKSSLKTDLIQKEKRTLYHFPLKDSQRHGG